MLYFAYGSNMDKADLDKWCRNHNYPPVKILSTEVTVLKGYVLKFNYNSHTREGGAANRGAGFRSRHELLFPAWSVPWRQRLFGENKAVLSDFGFQGLQSRLSVFEAHDSFSSPLFSTRRLIALSSFSLI